MSPRPPDWQLPPGVTPGLWEYLHDSHLAEQYLDKVSGSPFARADLQFVSECLPQLCSVIDLGCGPGRNLLPLAQRGFTCTGVDLSSHMLQEARQLLEKNQCQATWIEANLGTPLPLDSASFDAALCLFSTLGMLQPATVRASLLQEVSRILKPGGVFVVHVHNRWAIQGWSTLWSNRDVVTMPVHQGISNLQMKLYTERELRRDMAAAGFRVERWKYLSADHPDGSYQGSAWLAPWQAAGFLVMARVQEVANR